MKKALIFLIFVFQSFALRAGFNIGFLPRPILFVHGVNSNATTWGVDFGSTFYVVSPQGTIDNFIQHFHLNGNIRIQNDLQPLGNNGLEFFNASDPFLHIKSDGNSQAKEFFAKLEDVLETYFDNWKTNPNARVDIICHSQGGLVVREAIRENASEFLENPINHINSIVTLGTPHLGTAVATDNPGVGPVNSLRTAILQSYHNGAYNAITINIPLDGSVSIDPFLNFRTVIGKFDDIDNDLAYANGYVQNPWRPATSKVSGPGVTNGSQLITELVQSGYPRRPYDATKIPITTLFSDSPGIGSQMYQSILTTIDGYSEPQKSLVKNLLIAPLLTLLIWTTELDIFWSSSSDLVVDVSSQRGDGFFTTRSHPYKNTPLGLLSGDNGVPHLTLQGIGNNPVYYGQTAHWGEMISAIENPPGPPQLSVPFFFPTISSASQQAQSGEEITVYSNSPPLTSNILLPQNVSLSIEREALFNIQGFSIIVQGSGQIFLPKNQEARINVFVTPTVFLVRRQDGTIRGIFPSFVTAASTKLGDEQVESYRGNGVDLLLDVTNQVGIQNDRYGSITAIFANFLNNRNANISEYLKQKNLFFCNISQTNNGKQLNVLYENDGKTFKKLDLSFNAGTVFDPLDLSSSSQAVKIDYDQDGWDDLVVCNIANVTNGQPAPNYLYHNKGNSNLLGRSQGFERITTPSFTVLGSNTRGVAVGNFMGDPRPDLLFINTNLGLVPGTEGKIKVYMNNSKTNPSNPFLDVTDAVIDQASNEAGFAIKIVAMNQSSASPTIWILSGGHLKALTKDSNSGKYQANPNLSFSADNIFDVDFGSVGGTESPDIFVGGRLYINHGDGAFDDFTNASGISQVPNIRGVKMFDFDLDFRNDIFINTNDGYSLLYKNTTSLTNQLFVRHQIPSFTLTNVFVNAVSSGDLAAGLSIGNYNYNDPEKVKFDIVQCFLSPQSSNKVYKNIVPGTFTFTFALQGGFERFGSSFSDLAGIGGRVSLYQAGHFEDTSFLVQSQLIEQDGVGSVNIDRSSAHFNFQQDMAFDVVATFPSGRKQYLYNISSGTYLIDENPAKEYFVDYLNGNDNNSGLDLYHPLKTVQIALNKIPIGSAQTPFIISLLPGTHQVTAFSISSDRVFSLANNLVVRSYFSKNKAVLEATDCASNLIMSDFVS